MCPVPPLNSPAGADFTLTFPPVPQWVRGARDAVRTALGPALPGLSDLVDTAVLLTSELVTNAVVASSGSLRPGPVGLYAAWAPLEDAVRVLVHDTAPGNPASSAGLPPAEEEHGRGLPLISLYAKDWGVCHHGPGPGKTVWFRLGSGPCALAA